MLQPRTDAMLSSIERGMMDDTMTKVPAQMIYKKIGWLRLTIRCFLLMIVQANKHTARAIANAISVSPTALEDARLEINKFHYFLGTQILIFLVHFINQYIWLNNKNENKCAKSENKKSKVRIIIKVKIISENN